LAAFNELVSPGAHARSVQILVGLRLFAERACTIGKLGAAAGVRGFPGTLIAVTVEGRFGGPGFHPTATRRTTPTGKGEDRHEAGATKLMPHQDHLPEEAAGGSLFLFEHVKANLIVVRSAAVPRETTDVREGVVGT
jgi:hypothetical protein